MSDLHEMISDVELERKMEILLIEGKDRIDAICEDYGGLLIIHKKRSV